MLKGCLNSSFQREYWGGTGCQRMIYVSFNADKNFLKKNYRPADPLCCFYTKKRQIFVTGRFCPVYIFRKRLRKKHSQKALYTGYAN